MRLSRVALRTSPKAGGGWTTPTFRSRGTIIDNTVRGKTSVEDISMVKNKPGTLGEAVRTLVEASYVTQDADAKVFGGDGATHKNYLKGELKSMDKRIQPLNHEHLMADTLKTIDEFHAPNGQKVARSFLTGKIVGLLFFSESERCNAIMNLISQFARKHSPDFVVVAISLGGKENMHVTKSKGFYHVTHKDSAEWVTRDCGIMIRPWTPLPRMIIVNGNTGAEICRSGVTAVVTHPETCFQDWVNGEAGCDFTDYLKTWLV